MLLYVRRHFDLLAAEDRTHPPGGPSTLCRLIDRSERLQCNELRRFAQEHAADVVPIATHGKGCRPYRTSKIEGKNLRPAIAAELECHQRQQHGLTGACWPDHQRVPDVA